MQINKKLLSRIVLIFSVLLILTILAFKIVDAINKNSIALEEDLPVSYSLPIEYQNIFSEQFKNKLSIKQVLNSKVRNPIAFLNFENQFDFIVYKFNVDYPVKAIEVKQENVDRSTGFSYSVIDAGNFKFHYKAGGEMPMNKIELVISGDSLEKILKNDSIISYKVISKGFSICYANNQPVDFFFESKYNGFRLKKVPVIISFVRKGMNLFLCAIASRDLNKRFPLNLDQVFFRI